MIVSQTGEGIYAYFSRFAAILQGSLPHLVSIIVLSAPCPWRLSWTVWVWSMRGMVRLVEGRVRNVGCLSPTPLHFSTIFLIAVEYLPNSSSKQAAPFFMAPALTGYSNSVFTIPLPPTPSHLFRPMGNNSSQKRLILGSPISLVGSSNLPTTRRPPFIKVSLLRLSDSNKFFPWNPD